MARYTQEPDHRLLAAGHLDELRGFVARLNDVAATDKRVFLTDADAQAKGERNLHGALEAAMAAGSQALLWAESDLPNRYAEVFTSLAELRAIKPDLAQKMRDLEEVHDILVHGPISWDVVYGQLSTGPVFSEFGHELAAFLELNQ